MTTRTHALLTAAVTALVAQVSLAKKAELETLGLGTEILPGVKYRDLKNWLKDNGGNAPALPTVSEAKAATRNAKANTALANAEKTATPKANPEANVVEFKTAELKGAQLLIGRAKETIKTVVKSPEGVRVAITETGVRVPVVDIERNNRGNLRVIPVDRAVETAKAVGKAIDKVVAKAPAAKASATGVRSVELESSNLASATFDKPNKVMTVTFKNGNTYQYEGVGVRLFNEFVRAESHGKFFAANIKPAFHATKIGTADAPASAPVAKAPAAKPVVAVAAAKPKSEADEIKPSAIRDQVLFNGRKKELVTKVVRNGTSGRREAVCQSGERFPLWQIEQDAKGKFRVAELSAPVEANTVKGGVVPKENVRKPRVAAQAAQAPAPKAIANPRAAFTAPSVSTVRGSTFEIVKGAKSKNVTVAKVVKRNEIRYAITEAGALLPFDDITLKNGELTFTGKLTAAEYRAL